LLEVLRSSSPREALEAAVVTLVAPPTAARTTPVVAAVPAKAKSAPPTPVKEASPVSPVASSADGERWPKVVMLIKQKHNSLAALLAMYPVDVTDTGIVIKSRFNFHRDLFMKSPNRQAIEAAAEKVYGRPVPVTSVTEGGVDAPAPAASVDSQAELITSALEILGGEVVE
jgi:hypothetical protein